MVNKRAKELKLGITLKGVLGNLKVFRKEVTKNIGKFITNDKFDF